MPGSVRPQFGVRCSVFGVRLANLVMNLRLAEFVLIKKSSRGSV